MPLIDGSAGVEGLTMAFPFTPYPGHFLVRTAVAVLSNHSHAV